MNIIWCQVLHQVISSDSSLMNKVEKSSEHSIFHTGNVCVVAWENPSDVAASEKKEPAWKKKTTHYAFFISAFNVF